MDFFVYEAVKVLVARWGDEAARSANTPADRSKRATQLSPGAALPALCLLGSDGSGPFGKCRTRIGLFGIRDGEEDGCRIRIGLFGVRDRGKVMCECKPLSTVMYNWCCLRLCGVPGGVRLM